MFISKLRLKNFKRFTDLELNLSDINPPPRLVLLIGANGSGKSCVFDAFEWLSQAGKHRRRNTDLTYYRKHPQSSAEAEAEFSNGTTLSRIDNEFQRRDSKNDHIFYGRSAFRQVPQLTRTEIKTSRFPLEADEDRPRTYIQIDKRFENDVDTLAGKIIKEVFNGDRFDSEELKERYINPINESLGRIFGTNSATSLILYALIPPLEGKPADIRFRKGQSDIHYNLLSSGEKEILNILFNLFLRREYFRDTIYFIDELDVHLNTALQYTLLKEITENWIPEGCQFWTASHSLGFIQYAQEYIHAIILDFDQFDFDGPHTIVPQTKESSEVYEIAVPAEVLSNLFKDKQIVLCENKNDRLYQLLGLPRKVFYGVRDKNEVYYRVKNNPALQGLMDRDYMAPIEVASIRGRFPNLFVLDYYAFENYLYHPENLREAVPDFDHDKYKAEITRQKNDNYTRTLLGLKQARSYKVLKDENLEAPETAEEIAEALKSDDFETFYPYFDMKGKFNFQSLAKLNLPSEKLARTNWFRLAIGKVFE